MPDSQTLTTGLSTTLQDIARWRGQSQLVLSLLDGLHAAVATYDQALISQVIDLVTTAAPNVADASFDIILQEAVALGNSLRGTLEGIAISEQLYAMARQLGNRMSTGSIVELVQRGDSCSRTGLTTLGILYDDHYDHVSSLDLPAFFLTRSLPHVAYYCALRESDPTRKIYDWIGGPGEFRFGGLRFECSPDERFWDKMAKPWPVRYPRLLS